MTTEPTSMPRLGLVELLDRDGAVSHRVPIVRWPLTLGRGMDCDVVLDDPHTAALHARIEWRDDVPRLVVGDTRNGLRLGRKHLPAGSEVDLTSGAEWRIGRSRMRLRLAGEALAPEQPMRAASPRRGLAASIVLPLAAFSLSWPWLVRAGEALALALGCGLLYGHMSLLLPGRRRALALGFAAMFTVGLTLKLALNHQRTDRWFTPLYLSTLGPPALRLAPTIDPEHFIDQARALRAPLQQRAREPDGSSAADSMDDE